MCLRRTATNRHALLYEFRSLAIRQGPTLVRAVTSLRAIPIKRAVLTVSEKQDVVERRSVYPPPMLIRR